MKIEPLRFGIHSAGQYKHWLATRPCAVCGAYGVQLHHLAAWGLPRKLRNPLRDYVLIPLCPLHHNYDGDRNAAHRMDQREFLSYLGYTNPGEALLPIYRDYAREFAVVLPPNLGPRAAAEWLLEHETSG